MPWQMQINLGTEEELRWSSVRCSGTDKPYEFLSKKEAEYMLNICYPDQCREDRLDRKQVRTRVIKVEG